MAKRSAETGKDVVEAYLQSLDAEELRDLVRVLAGMDERAAGWLALRAATAAGDVDRVAAELKDRVRDVLAVRGFVEYRRSFEIARNAQDMLDELERQLADGAADAVRPALLLALTRLRTISLKADDSGGVIGSACQRAADLYARSCREGRPKPLPLAKWLVSFRGDSPGWPNLSLADFAPAFDAKALAAYRAGVHALDEKTVGERYGRFEVELMLLELADHDGDVDRAVELLSARENPQFGAIIDRLRRVGRDEEVVTWTDRAVAEGRVSSRLGSQGRDFWLDPAEVADTYASVGRVDDGVAVLRAAVSTRPGSESVGRLVAFAERFGRGPAERAWAEAELHRLAARTDGAALVDLALAEEDLDGAWEAARQYGAGGAAMRLIAASIEVRPLDAAVLYRAQIDADLQVADTRRYRGVALALGELRTLYMRAGRGEEFAAYVADIRTTHRRRTSLMAALDRRGL